MVAIPRFVIAAPASGHGKTTVATGLMAALRRAGHTVSGHKIGPDYIDPGYHALATGRPGRNLDPHLVGDDLVAPLFLHGASGADMAVVEGVMGLYDGMLGTDGYASTAHVAGLLSAPVILVVDISHASRSIAAVVHGMASYDRGVRISGVILNKAGSPRHSDEVVSALESTGIPVLGVLQRDDGIAAPSRHLGLVPAQERAEAAGQLDRLASQITEHIDLDEVERIARSAPDLAATPWTPPISGADGPVIAVAGGRAFTFRYTETEEILRAAGCRTVTFDPLRDETLPDDTAGIYLGGGFPEVHAADISSNAPLREHLRSAIAGGVPTVAECAGLLYLCRDVDGADMVGALDVSARMTPRLTLGYRTAIAPADSLLGPAGTRVTGHEFHRTTVEPGTSPAWLLNGRPDGFATATLHASYLHTHWAGHPRLAERFVAAARAATPVASPPRIPRVVVPDLHHHGDRDVADGLIDLAVNVSRRPRPGWLDEALRSSLDALDRYPDPDAARAALAGRHRRSIDDVLPTAGGAEAFTLIARARPWRMPVVVHPQFTEPEAALLAAGHEVRRVLLRVGDGFRLDPATVPDDADLVIVGNPTNPTSVLHPASTLRSLVRPGRVVVIDEAFMDAIPGETESLSNEGISGLITVRSLTKTWAIPGVRAGYVVGDPEIVVDLAAQQPPWSVSTPAAAAMIACAAPRATDEASVIADEITTDRAALVEALTGLGLEVAGDPAAPFVLVRVVQGTREALRSKGFALRRGDTFPGLDDEWVRIAVRDRAVTDALTDAWRSIL
ncbi:cobyrinate a,c-diamide synthase [Rhodococcus sp. F64268]|uniref:cobyrinate a,c-diamide synthase n=1 Tax=Rhodococcus sp. F64268 TaxID=2926402 RepID=UPI001FF32B54|nr:cobyrinate a,c-diamide synthase [Rhodococcus sp. F64268]MCK0090372.1 cobyrinate a,c-diamide synthase [Rhodococcus sp. F64268]